MGGSKKQTIGYWYKWLMHLGWCRGEVDALLELRAGGDDYILWQGRMTSSGTLSINKSDLWGGEKGEGGAQGTMDVLFGEATQAPNDYLRQILGENQTAHRGKVTTVWRGGRWGAFVPNPKSVSGKWERILKGWQDDTPWYPEKAAITVGSMDVGFDQDGWRYRVEPPGSSADYSDPGYDDAAWPTGRGGFGDANLGGNLGVGTFIPSGETGKSIWIRRQIETTPGASLEIHVYHDDGAWLWVNGQPVPIADVTYYHGIATVDGSLVQATNLVVLKVTDGIPGGSPTHIFAGLTVHQAGTYVNAMNPAHILYDSITHEEMMGWPVGMINDASFRAAADQLYAEGFGLCTEYDGDKETVEQFQQRICNVIGANLTKSRVDGLYYLDLIRGGGNAADLPVIDEDDVVAYKRDQSVPTESINAISVNWRDPVNKGDRTTAPVRAAGTIRAAGGQNADTRDYFEIPFESLALRVAARDLQAEVAPLAKFTLSTNRKYRALRPGNYVRLRMPSEQIDDMVCVVGSVDLGTHRNGTMELTLIQDVFSLPETTYVSEQPPVWSPPARIPRPSPYQRAFEVPYVELAASLSTADLNTLTPDMAYLGAVGSRPDAGINYTLATATGAEAYQTYGASDWCPIAFATVATDEIVTTIPITGGTDLDRVEVGSWALWDNEVVRVDVVDEAGGTVTLGRGCADTIPQQHPANSVIYFAGDWLATDGREYVQGETVSAKLLTQAGTTLPLELAPARSATMAARAGRPYPPGEVQLNGAAPWGTPAITGHIGLTWAHRARVLQADKLVDFNQGSVGPDAGTTYNVRVYDASDNQVAAINGINGTSLTYVPVEEGAYRVELESECAGLVSLQHYSINLTITDLDILYYATEDDDGLYSTEDGSGFYQAE
jgi:hypothetical protein